MTAPILVAVFTVGFLALTIFFCRKCKLTIKNLCLGALCCAATIVLYSILIPLPTGAAMSCGAMIPLMVLSFVAGPELAMACGFLCGLLSLFLLPGWAPVHWAQFFVEHWVCFPALGYAGLLGYDKKWKVAAGCVLALVLVFLGHVFSGVLFFSGNAWQGWGPWAYSIGYQTSKIIEYALTLVIVTVLPLPVLARAAGKGGRS